MIYLGVWRRGGETDFEVPLDRAFPGKELEVSCIYPKSCGDVFHYDDYSKKLKVHFPETYMARLFQIKMKCNYSEPCEMEEKSRIMLA